MAYYAYVLTVNRLELDAYVGFYEQERNALQPIEVSFRLYFENPPAGALDEDEAFFDYGVLSDALRAFVQDKKFRLIERMTVEMFAHLRGVVDQMGGADGKLWVQLNKIKAPVPRLLGGASFIHSDLPADATFIPSVYP